MTERLAPALLPKLDASVARPRVARANLAEGVVHLGLGAFVRAHLAAYLDEVAARGDWRWGIVGVSLRSPAVRDTLAVRAQRDSNNTPAHVATRGDVVEVGGLVRAVERAETEVDHAFGQRVPVVAGPLDRGAEFRRQRGRETLGHSLYAALARLYARSAASSCASSSSSRCSATSCASQVQSIRRATSCRAGIDRNARVSSLKPTVL